MLNGDGLRVVLWVAGCEHGCKGCQNPVTWDVNGGLEFDENAKKEIFDELDKDYVSGVTLSGGDPLHCKNRFDIGKLVNEISEKYPNKSIYEIFLDNLSRSSKIIYVVSLGLTVFPLI